MSIDILEELRDKSADDLTDGAVPEELRGKTPDELQKFVEVLDAHLRSIHQTDEGELRDKTPAEQTAFDYGLKLRDIAIKRIDEHRAVQEVFKRRPKAVEQAMFNISMSGRDKEDPYGDVRRMNTGEARDRSLRVLDDRNSTMHLSDQQKSHIERQLRVDTDIARRILVTEHPEYRSAWQKLVTDPHPILTQDEQRAVLAYNEYRAMSEGTSEIGRAHV